MQHEPKYAELGAKVVVKSEEMFGNVPKSDLQSTAKETKNEEKTKNC